MNSLFVYFWTLRVWYGIKLLRWARVHSDYKQRERIFIKLERMGFSAYSFDETSGGPW